MPTQVDLIEDPVLREMVRMAARDLTTYLEANAVDPATIDPDGAAWFMVHAIEGPARFAAWRDLIAFRSGSATPDARFDRDPAALAWARAKVQREVDKLSGWQATDAAAGETERSKVWRRHVNHLKRTFLGGDGCVIAAFDERLPQVRAEMDRLVPEQAPPLDPNLVRLVAFAMDGHDFNSDHCRPTPGEDCWGWCHACKVLADLPAEVLEAGRAWLVATGRDLAGFVAAAPAPRPTNDEIRARYDPLVLRVFDLTAEERFQGQRPLGLRTVDTVMRVCAAGLGVDLADVEPSALPVDDPAWIHEVCGQIGHPGAGFFAQRIPKLVVAAWGRASAELESANR